MKQEIKYKDPSLPVEERVEDLLTRMTIEEKLAQLGSCWVYQLLSGGEFSEDRAAEIMSDGLGQVTRVGGASNLAPRESALVANQIQRFLVEKTRLGIPGLIHEEACSGYMAKGATCFPQTIGVSCTWNPELVEAMGEVIKNQVRAVGAHQVLAPLLDVTRDPRWGRVEETFGEDPYLVSRMGVSYINGLQSNDWNTGVVATGKHFVGYGNSEGGMNWAPAHIPERELHEVFLAPFEAAVKEANLFSVMNAYHELDGVPCAASRELLTDILRQKWGFKGIVVSDYFAVNMLYEYHHIARNKNDAAKLALEAGIDVELPNTDCYGSPLKEALANGEIEIDYVDDAVRRILRTKFMLGLFENPFVDPQKVPTIFDTTEQRHLAYQIARESIVLLKNEENLLPLNKGIESIAVIGPNADNTRNLVGDYAYPCHLENLIEVYEGNNAMGQPMPEKLDFEDNFVPIKGILESIKERVSPNTVVRYAKGCDILGQSREGFQEAVEIARKAKVAIVILGDKAGLVPDCTVGESRDMAEINLPGVQENLLRAIYETGTPVVAILVNGRPYSVNWLDQNIPAIMEAWLPGEEGARAVTDVLFGDYNPGGKLSITVPRSSGQIPTYYYHKKSGGRSHWRGDYVDISSKPLYPFGYGLSYTRFEYENIKIDRQEVSIGDSIKISFDVINTGPFKGDEIVQLYINDEEASITRPVKELKGFKRIPIDVQESKRVTFTLSTTQLGFYDKGGKYVVEPGKINIMIGSSSSDIKLRSSFELTGQTRVITERKFFSKCQVEPK